MYVVQISIDARRHGLMSIGGPLLMAFKMPLTLQPSSPAGHVICEEETRVRHDENGKRVHPNNPNRMS